MKTEKKKLKIGVAAVLILAFFMAIIFFIVKIFFLQSAEPELNPVAAKLILSKDKTSVVGVENRAEATYVEIPNEVTSIGHAAFAGCKKLTSISIPNGVERIGNYAFSHCWGLRSITIPKSVISMGWYSFPQCYVTEKNIKDESEKELGGLTIVDTDKDGFCILDKKLLKYRNTSTEKNVSIPKGVTSIEELAFWKCSNLTSITIPKGVTTIEDGAFLGCSGLTSITIPKGVTSIGGFDECSSLTSITIPEGVTTIKRGAFWGCSGLTSITIPKSVIHIEDDAFYGCYVTKENFKNESKAEASGLTIIDTDKDGFCIKGNKLCRYRSNRTETNIQIPNSVTSIGEKAFEGCSNFSGINIPNSVTNIEDYAFDGCCNIIKLSIPKSVTKVGENSFHDCYVTRINFNNESKVDLETKGLTIVDTDDKGFCVRNHILCKYRYSRKEKDITIPKGITAIGEKAFYDCRNIISIEIPNGVTSIGDSAFRLCMQLESIDIPNGVTNIGKDAFSECELLSSIDIPNSVTSIGECAFGRVGNVNYSGSVSGAPWGARALNGVEQEGL